MLIDGSSCIQSPCVTLVICFDFINLAIYCKQYKPLDNLLILKWNGNVPEFEPLDPFVWEFEDSKINISTM